MRRLFVAALLMGTMSAGAQSLVSENVFKDITTLAKVRSNRFATPSPAGKLRKAGKPVAFYIGDSTMRTNSDGQGWNGQWGFGLFAQEWFDADELVVENHGWGGTTSETYYTGKWAAVKSGIKEGDFVVIDFGHNDKSADVFETYMNKYIDEVRALGATPILCSRTPRCSSGKPSADNTYRPRGIAVAKAKGVSYIDLQAQAMPMYTAFGTWKTTQFYQDGKLHTSLLGAWHNAYCHALAIAADKDNPLYPYLKDTTPAKMDIERQASRPYTFTVGGDDTSARGTFRSGRWSLLYNTLEKGDTVKLAFGANELKSMLSSGELGCIQSADEQQEVKQMSSTSRFETVYSYGWYIHYFLNDIKEKQAVGVLVNEEGVTPEKVAAWNETLAKQYGVKLQLLNTATAISSTSAGAGTTATTVRSLSGRPVGPAYQGVVVSGGRKWVQRR
ncbi:MAG: hypothetical protein IJ533_08090 [Prevotella sp.]|nr:hypothetical protein [Prevotella sp.]